MNRARLWLLVGAGAASVAALIGCPAGTPDICEGAACIGVDGGGGDGSQVDGSPTCDPSKDPTCVSDGSGIFVNGLNGSDGAAGTKEAPVKTIGAALTKATGSKSAVYICARTYAEHVKVTSAISLYGGFACADWTYAATNKAKIAPSDAGYALDIESVASAIAVADLEFDAAAGTSAAPSSVAAFVNASPQVTMSRVILTAGAGAKGADGSSSASTTLTRGLKGNNADGGAGGPAQTCPCPDGNTIGGKGGSFAPSQFNGENGKPDLGGTAPNNGLGGTGGLATCTAVGAGGIGAPGADGDAGSNAASAQAIGEVDATGFHPASGSAGTGGGRAQGGGGGGATTVGTGAGGGGCGGCGGALGGGGGGGGASIALLANSAPVTLVGCTLSADVGAAGGNGGDPQAGAQGGGAGVDINGTSCNGGVGGTGGNGGSGGGGAGGISVAIVQRGGAPQVDSSTQMSVKTSGNGGAPGAGGTGNGVAGVAQNILALP